MVQVYFTNRTKDKKLDQLRGKIKKIIVKGAEILKIKKDLQIYIIFVDRSEIKKQNLKYFKKDLATDVISCKSEIPIKKSRLLGDIIICPQVAAVNARKLNHALAKEIQILTLHGLLHLTELDHEKLKEQTKWQRIFKNLEKIVK